MLDEEHDDLERAENDENLYTLGSIAGHNVVLACLPAGQTGNNGTAALVTRLTATFKSIRFGLMVGIGGGVPGTRDIRLGDVVVSQPHGMHGGIVQYDFGKDTPDGFARTGSLDTPPHLLLSAVSKLRANHLCGKSKLAERIISLRRNPRFRRERAGSDTLFESDYDHKQGDTCESCDPAKQVKRQPRKRKEEVVVHYGTIASGNRVMRSGLERDKVSRDLGGVLCFEMEAAGLMNNFPCIAIRGKLLVA